MRLSCHFVFFVNGIIHNSDSFILDAGSAGDRATMQQAQAVSFIFQLFSLRVRMPTQCRTIVVQQGNEWFISDFISTEGVGLFPTAFRARTRRGAIGFRLWWKLESQLFLGKESWLQNEEENRGGKVRTPSLAFDEPLGLPEV
jgi:hypothetical protein